MKGVHKHLAILFMIFFAVSILVPASGQQGYSIISGRVIDVESGEPIQNATIMILGYYRDPRSYGDSPRRTYVKSTDSLGFFSVNVEPTAGYTGFWYNVYALCDRNETPGVDYVPAKWSTYLEIRSQASFIFLLQPGASLFLPGEIRFVESPSPSYRHNFMVLSPSGKSVVSSYSISTYGIVSDVTNLNLNQSLVIVPAEKEVIIKVGARVPLPPSSIYHEFIVDGKVGFFKLAQGASLSVDVREYCFKFNVANVRENINLAIHLLQDAEDAGFLVKTERRDLLEALSLVDKSMVSMKKESYYESFATLRSAYLLTAETTGRLQGLFMVSSQSAPILTFFFTFIAIAITSLILERGAGLDVTVKEKHFVTIPVSPLITTAVYTSLLGLFFILFPGCQLIPFTTFTAIGVFSLLFGQIAVMVLPRLLAEKRTEGRYIAFRSAVIAVFSIACRNLRRRKMRTTLSIVTIMILVFGFIALTSVAPSYGLVSRHLGASKVSADALSIRVPHSPETLFDPLPSEFLPWLEKQPNVTLVAPKAENFPLLYALGTLYTSSNALMAVQGVLGIVPSLESKVTMINNIVIQGEYLQDNDYDGVLISSSLAARLGVKVGEPLYGFGKRFFVRGLFDSGLMEKLLDLDGNFMIPMRASYVGYYACVGDEIIVTTFETALTLPSVAISRVIVQLKDPEGLLNFARTIALVHEYETWVSIEGTLYAQYVGSYMEEKGLGSIPLLMSLVLLNISLTMLGSVNERRPEIAAMSSIGLNPTHIIALFMAEATVLGFVGGGLGYLLGISGYRVATAPVLGALQVREKVSAEWGILALLLSIIAAVLASALPAIKASTIVTPSLLRKWRLEETGSPKQVGRPWTVDLPVKLRPREVDTFVSFIQKRLQSLAGGSPSFLERIEGLKREDADTGEGPLKRLSLKHYYREDKSLGTNNELIVSRPVGKDYFDAQLVSLPLRGVRESVHRVVTYVRRLIFEWNTMTFKVATPVDQSLSQLYTLINVYNPTSLFIASSEFDFQKRLKLLAERLDLEGIRVPELVVYQMNPLDIEECRKKTEEMVSRANVVCLSGGSSSICAALAMNAAKQDKMMCHVVDSRSQEEQRANPFHVLKVVNISTETVSQSRS